MGTSNQNNSRSSAKPAKRPIGQILVDGEFISPQDLKLALEQQKHTNELLGEALVRMGVLDPADLKIVLSVQSDFASIEDAVKTTGGVCQLLGDLLIKAKHITQEQLDLVLREQQKTGEKLGEALIRLGLLTGSELDAALTFQQHLCDPVQASERLRIGEILVATSIISREQLKDALDRQKISKKRIDHVLIEAGYAQPQHITHALDIQKKLVAAALIASLSFASMAYMADAESGGNSASLPITVTATVEPLASIKIDYQSTEIIVTTADIIRGYVDIQKGSRIEIKSNSPAGYLLAFEGLGEPFKEVQVQGLGKDIQIGTGSGWIAQPYSGSTVMAELNYRFVLSENPQPGTYAWPLAISVIPRQ